MHKGDENIIQFMKSLYATLYFSSVFIPGVLRAPGSCHLGGCTLSLRQAESGLGSCWDPVGWGNGWASLGAGATFLQPWTLQALLLCLCHLDTARDRRWTRGWGNFLTKRGSCWEEERSPATPELVSPPANGPQRLLLHAGVWEALFGEEI